MRKFFSFMLVVAAVTISIKFWAIMIKMLAWAIVFLTGSLHSSDLTAVPALSFRQSVGIVTLLSLLALSLQAGRNNSNRGQ